MCSPLALTQREVTRTETYLNLDGEEFTEYEVRELLQGLFNTDPYFKRLLVSNEDLQRALEARQVLTGSTRGSVYKSKGFEAFVAEFEILTKYKLERE